MIKDIVIEYTEELFPGYQVTYCEGKDLSIIIGSKDVTNKCVFASLDSVDLDDINERTYNFNLFIKSDELITDLEVALDYLNSYPEIIDITAYNMASNGCQLINYSGSNWLQMNLQIKC